MHVENVFMFSTPSKSIQFTFLGLNTTLLKLKTILMIVRMKTTVTSVGFVGLFSQPMKLLIITRTVTYSVNNATFVFITSNN